MLDKLREALQSFLTTIKEFFQRKKKEEGESAVSPAEDQAAAEMPDEVEERWTFKDVFWVFMRTLKILSNVLFTVGVVCLIFGAGIAAGYAASLFHQAQVPTKEELLTQVNKLSGISELRYADGSIISQVDSDLLRIPVEGKSISDNVKKAVIATEDENFQSHNGIVPKAVIRATLGSVVGVGSSSGGSTITQQLIKQQVVGDAPTFSRKATEILDALALERSMSKEEILTAYLNIAPFGRNHKGQNIAGVEEAAQGIFGVKASELSVPQAAFIAGLPQSPISYSPYQSNGAFKDDESMALGIDRQKDVLYNMYRTGVLSEEAYNDAVAYDIKQDFLQPGDASATDHDYLYYTALAEAQDAVYDYIIERDKVSSRDLKNEDTVASYKELAKKELSEGGYIVTTTINKGVHEAMQNAVATYGGQLDDGTGFVDTGNVLMNNQTGAVLGFVGGRDYANNKNNHAFNTVRSPGSTIKPLIAYGIAIDQGLMGSRSILSNYPTNFSSGEPIMHVSSRGTAMMNLQDALNRSTNITAYWTYLMLRNQGVDVKGYMEKMGYDIREYGIESLPLGGGIEVSVAQHTNGFQTLANNGTYMKRYMVDKIQTRDGKVVYQHKANPVQVYSKPTATIMQDLMRGVIDSGTTTTFKSRLAGINPSLANNVDWIGKTGTSSDAVDMWLMLSTPTVSLGGWIGHEDNASMTTFTGYNNNAQYMANLVNAINNADPSIFGAGQRFQLDPGVIRSQVLESTGQRPGNVTVNGRSVSLSGPTVVSYWAKNGAPNTQYHFAIGGSEADYQAAWSQILGGGSSSNSNNSNNNRTTTRR